jgi:hypothetical protein
MQKKETKMELKTEEVKNLIGRVGARLGYDYTHNPYFPEGRDDICAVVHTTENGSTYGFDTVFLVWKEPNGSINYRELKNSRSTKDYIHVESISVKSDGSISIEFGSGGSYSGTPWSSEMKAEIITQSAKISNQSPTAYPAIAQLAMLKVVENNQHTHPMYAQTAITEFIIDKDSKRGIFILFEQIDTDRSHPDSEGYLGDQFRYSIWKIDSSGESDRIYEDHAYIRPRSINTITKTRGRDCCLKNLKLEAEVITVTHLKGERVEEQIPEELTFVF